MGFYATPITSTTPFIWLSQVLFIFLSYCIEIISPTFKNLPCFSLIFFAVFHTKCPCFYVYQREHLSDKIFHWIWTAKSWIQIHKVLTRNPSLMINLFFPMFKTLQNTIKQIYQIISIFTYSFYKSWIVIPFGKTYFRTSFYFRIYDFNLIILDMFLQPREDRSFLKVIVESFVLFLQQWN